MFNRLDVVSKYTVTLLGCGELGGIVVLKLYQKKQIKISNKMTLKYINFL